VPQRVHLKTPDAPSKRWVGPTTTSIQSANANIPGSVFLDGRLYLAGGAWLLTGIAVAVSRPFFIPWTIGVTLCIGLISFVWCPRRT
jgi:hypothetical protein